VPGRGAYHAAKHGVLGLTKSAALEYAARGIRINAVCPGIIDTPMVAGMKEHETEEMEALMEQVPIGRLGRAEEIAEPVLWLCGPGSSFVTGHALVGTPSSASQSWARAPRSLSRFGRTLRTTK